MPGRGRQDAQVGLSVIWEQAGSHQMGLEEIIHGKQTGSGEGLIKVGSIHLTHCENGSLINSHIAQSFNLSLRFLTTERAGPWFPGRVNKTAKRINLQQSQPYGLELAFGSLSCSKVWS